MAQLTKNYILKGKHRTDCKRLFDNGRSRNGIYFAKIDGVNAYIAIGETSDSRATKGRVLIDGATKAIMNSGKPPYNKVEYTTPGSFTFTVPVGVTVIKVTVAGAGGGGASGDRHLDGVYGGYGGTGEGITQNINVTANDTCSITVGAGGSAGIQGASGHPVATDGKAGGNSSISVGDATVTARGGGGGKAAHGSAGANGTSYTGGAAGGRNGAYAGEEYRYPTGGANGWVYIEYGGDI